MDYVLAFLFFASVVGIFKPYLGRLRRVHFVLASIGFFFAFAAVLPKPDKPDRGSEVTSEPKGAKVEPAKIDKLPLVQAFQTEIFNGMASCDAAGKKFAEVAGSLGSGSNSLYDGYSSAKRMEEACRESWSALSNVKVPTGLTDDGAKKAEESIETCSDAALAKQSAASHMAEIFDGNMKPSMVSEGQEKAELSQKALLACVASIFVVAEAEGVDVSKLSQK